MNAFQGKDKMFIRGGVILRLETVYKKGCINGFLKKVNIVEHTEAFRLTLFRVQNVRT